MSTGRRIYVPGFQLLNDLEKVRTYPLGIAVATAKGSAMIITAAYAVLATTLQSLTPVFVGISNNKYTAAQAVANGTVNVEVIPPLNEYDWMVPDTDNVLQASDVGTLADLQDSVSIDNSDVVTAGLGFFIDAIDISSGALAANSKGYAFGHFEYTWAS